MGQGRRKLFDEMLATAYPEPVGISGAAGANQPDGADGKYSGGGV